VQSRIFERSTCRKVVEEQLILVTPIPILAPDEEGRR
jgi:hypothetical protein